MTHEDALKLLVWVSERLADDTEDSDIVAGVLQRVNQKGRR